MTEGLFEEPYRNYNFKIMWGNEVAAHFTEVRGLNIEIDAIRYREGGVNQVTHVLPGRVTYGDVVLRYGVSRSSRFFDWFLSAVKGKVERKDISLVLLDADGSSERLRWNLQSAWPRAWSGADFSANGSDIAIESITVVYESIERDGA